MKRLEIGAEVLATIEHARRKFANPDIGSSLEARIIDRELRELEQEWRSNLASPNSR
jgi:hypothetical protein